MKTFKTRGGVYPRVSYREKTEMANKDGFKARILSEIQAERKRLDNLEAQVKRGSSREADPEPDEDTDEDTEPVKPKAKGKRETDAEPDADADEENETPDWP